MKQMIQKGLVLAVLGLTTLLSPVFAGGDSYRIYLNHKLILQQYVGRPLDLESLPLSAANSNDKLVVYYNHCGEIGKGRAISIRDEKGVVLKEWKFANSTSTDPTADAGMIIPVKEILELQAKNPGLSMYYSAQQLPAGRLLTKVGKAAKPLAALTIQNR